MTLAELFIYNPGTLLSVSYIAKIVREKKEPISMSQQEMQFAFVLILFTALIIVINVVFNRKR